MQIMHSDNIFSCRHKRASLTRNIHTDVDEKSVGRNWGQGDTPIDSNQMIHTLSVDSFVLNQMNHNKFIDSIDSNQ